MRRWAEMPREARRGKDQLKVRNLSADERYSTAIWYFLATTDVSRLTPKMAEGDAPREILALELR